MRRSQWCALFVAALVCSTLATPAFAGDRSPEPRPVTTADRAGLWQSALDALPRFLARLGGLRPSLPADSDKGEHPWDSDGCGSNGIAVLKTSAPAPICPVGSVQ